MACQNCPSTVQPPASAKAGRPSVIRTQARSYTEEQAIIAKYPGYSVRRQVLGSNSVVLVLTKI